jgi:hypothetical protein
MPNYVSLNLAKDSKILTYLPKYWSNNRKWNKDLFTFNYP